MPVNTYLMSLFAQSGKIVSMCKAAAHVEVKSDEFGDTEMMIACVECHPAIVEWRGIHIIVAKNVY